jgi:acetyltransferase-like isoleucine patch superfamily enzyme
VSIFTSPGNPRRLLCFGTSGTCVQVAFDVAVQTGPDHEFAGYVVDGAHEERHFDGFPIYSYEEALALDDVGVFVPVGSPRGRRRVMERLQADGVPLVGARGDTDRLSHPTAEVGEGSIVTATTRLGPFARLGRGVLALNDMIAHDAEIGDYTTLAPGSTVLGHAKIGSNVLIGARAVIHNGTARRPLTIGDNAVIGAGAVVDRDVLPGERMVSPRALPSEEWLALRRLAGGLTE